MPNNNRPRRKPSKKGPNKHKNTNSAPRKVEAVKEITYSDSLTVGQLANLLHKTVPK